MSFIDDNRRTRRALFDLITQPPEGGAITLLRYQVDLADAIRAAEARLKDCLEDAHELIDHIHRVRTYADSMVWLLLHPHAIRQLGKNSLVKKNLLAQGAAFDNTMAQAATLCSSTGLAVFVAEITNVIRIGDLVLVTDAESPTIVECKTRLPDPEHLLQGRVGRQVSRAIGTAEYLRGRSIRVFGESQPRIVIESKHAREWHWEEVEYVCRQAVEHGVGDLMLSTGNWICAVHSSWRERGVEEIAKRSPRGNNWHVGFSPGGRDDLYPPACAWPLPADLRFDLSEGDISIVRLVDPTVYARDYGEGRMLQVRVGDYPFVVSVRGQEIHFSERFLEDAIFGFETIESCVQGILSTADGFPQNLPEELETGPSSKPIVFEIDDMEELESLIGRPDVRDHDLVAFPVRNPAYSGMGYTLVTGTSDKSFALARMDELRRLHSPRLR